MSGTEQNQSAAPDKNAANPSGNKKTQAQPEVERFVIKVYADDYYCVDGVIKVTQKEAESAKTIITLHEKDAKTGKIGKEIYSTKERKAEYVKRVKNFSIFNEYVILEVVKDNKKLDPNKIAFVKGEIRLEINAEKKDYKTQNETQVKWDWLIDKSWKPKDKDETRKKLNNIAIGLDDKTTAFKKGDKNDAQIMSIVKANLVALGVLSKDKSKQGEEEIEKAVTRFQDDYSIDDPKEKLHNYNPFKLEITKNKGTIERHTLLAMDEALVRKWPKILKHKIWANDRELNTLAYGVEQEAYQSGNKSKEVKLIGESLKELGLLTQIRKDAPATRFGDLIKGNVEVFQTYYKPSKVEEKSQIHKYERKDWENKIKKGALDQLTLLAMDEALVNGWKFKPIIIKGQSYFRYPLILLKLGYDHEKQVFKKNAHI